MNIYRRFYLYLLIYHEIPLISLHFELITQGRIKWKADKTSVCHVRLEYYVERVICSVYMGVQCVVHWLHHREHSDAMDVILLLVWVTIFPLVF